MTVPAVYLEILAMRTFPNLLLEMFAFLCRHTSTCADLLLFFVTKAACFFARSFQA